MSKFIEQRLQEAVYLKRGKNLFNKEDILMGYYINNNGNPQSQATTFCSNYIEVVEGRTIIKTRTQWNSIGLYDENKTFISRISTDENGKLTLQKNCKYIRISDLLENLDIIQVEYGLEATEYEAYVEKRLLDARGEEIVNLDEMKNTQKTKTIWERKCLRNWYYNRIKRSFEKEYSVYIHILWYFSNIFNAISIDISK